MSDAIGWVATALFGVSYLFRNPQMLRFFQAFSASIWIVYGLMIGAMPVVAANAVVASLALFSAWRQRAQTAQTLSSQSASAH